MKRREILSALATLLALTTGLSAQRLEERGSFPAVGALVLSPDGKYLAGGCRLDRGITLRVWETARGKQVALFEGQRVSPYSIVFSGDGKRLAAISSHALCIWDFASGKLLARLGSRDFYSLGLSHDGKTLGAMGHSSAKVWNVPSGRERRSFDNLVTANARAFSPDLATIAVGNYQEVDLWNTTTGKKRILSEHRGAVCCLAYTADGKTLLAASHHSLGDVVTFAGEVKLWDPATGRERAILMAKVGSVCSLALSRDGKRLALLDRKNIREDAALRVFDLPSGRERLMLKGNGRVFQSVVSRGDNLFVLGTEKTRARLWQITLPKK
jgi:WD40 repeat protein